MDNNQNIVLTENLKFSCEKCNFNCSKKGDYTRHLKSKKHLGKIQQNTTLHICDICNKTYNHRASLFNHKKTCQQVTNNQSQPNETNELLKTLISTIQETNQILSKLSK